MEGRGEGSRLHLHSCRRLWSECSGAPTWPPGRPVSPLAAGGSPWCCAAGKSVSSPHGGATTKAYLESSHAPPAGMNARMQQQWYLDGVCMAVSRC